jgi:hypothetical protein
MVFWGLAELLVHRRRAVLTGLVLLVHICAYGVHGALPVVHLALEQVSEPVLLTGLSQWWGQALLNLSVGAAFLLAFFLRFVFPMALGGFAAAVSIALLVVVLFPLDRPDAARAAAGGLGLLILGIAVALDVSDRLRLTWRSDGAFWLHLVSAPYIVFAFVGPQVIDLIRRRVSPTGFEEGHWPTLVAVLVVMMIASLIFDRRSLILSSVLAWGVVFYLAFDGADLDWTSSIAVVFLALGVMVLFLGVFWRTLRRALWRVTAWLPVWSYLSPVSGDRP